MADGCPAPAGEGEKEEDKANRRRQQEEVVRVAPSLVEGGGMGLFARQAFSPKETLTSDPALARLATEAFELQDLAVLAEAYHKLEESGERDLLVGKGGGPNLYKGPGEGGRWDNFAKCVQSLLPDGPPEECAIFMDTLLALSYNAHISMPEERFHVVFGLLSKANHSCAPNAAVVAPDHGPGVLLCERPIAPGDEVTISYLASRDLLLPRDRRRQLLSDGWEFECRCVRCSSPVDDMRRFGCGSGCDGRCFVARGAGASDEASRCSKCGQVPSAAHLAEWLAAEAKIAEVTEHLPGSLYSAWADAEDFAEEHPEHWLTGRWKGFLSSHLEAEAESEDDEAMVKELHALVHKHRAQQRRAEKIFGFEGIAVC